MRLAVCSVCLVTHPQRKDGLLQRHARHLPSGGKVLCEGSEREPWREDE